ncbi:MAG: exosortase [Fuerstia sp.]|nr:exosortase [Fuerstiella sp.]
MSAGPSVQVVSSLRRNLLLGGLIAVHLPLLVHYLKSLWTQTHYQFFPFAIVAFVWLLATRRSRNDERWTWPTWVLIAADLGCLAAGTYVNSPWLAAVGLALGLTALCFANRDAGYDRRLTYLALLPLIVVRLPLQYDLLVINWLQRLTTEVASNILHRLGTLHFREGNLLQFPGKTFMVAEACSGVQSLFTILFLAALVICLRRRSIVHGAVLLASGIVFAGLMNTTRVVTIAVAWERYATDLTSGMSHDVLGYICLAAAALLLLSADAFLGFVTDPVPDIARPGKVGGFWNPLIRLWNQLVAVIPSTASGVFNDKPRDSAAQVQAAQVQADGEQREFPKGFQLVKPINVFHFFLGWAESWFYSRNYRQLMAGFPFAAVALAGALFGGWVNDAATDPMIERYENAFNEAVQSSDIVRQETYLRGLDSLRPNEARYRFRLAMFMFQQGRTNEGLNEILRLTPETSLGFADARMWLVKQAMEPRPVKPLSLDEIENQLKTVLRQLPQHVEAHQLLAKLYISRKEWKLAEQQLTDLARDMPEENLALARLRKSLNRDPREVQAVAQLAVAALTAKLEADRTNPNTRTDLVEALMLVGKDIEAREILVSGLAQKDDPLLRTALSDFDLFQVDRRLAASPLNRDASAPVVIQALERDPGNLSGVQRLLLLHNMGIEVSRDSIRTALDHWQKIVAAKPDDIDARVVLSQLLFAVGDFSGAAEALRPTIDQRPEFRLSLADLLRKSGQSAEARALFEVVLQESRSKLDENPKDAAAAARMATAQLGLEQADEAKNLLAAFAEDPTKNRIPADPALASLYGQACIACFDKLTGYVSEPRKMTESMFLESSAELKPGLLQELLQDAAGCSATANQAVDRIARLSLSSHPAAAEAEELVRQLRLEGTQGAQVLNILGMHALVMKRFDKARIWLEQANAQTRGRDPMILNNLATAIVRGGDNNNERALQLANETLALVPDHPDALSTRGEIYVAMERWQDAVADLTESLKLRSNSAELHRLLEKAYTGLPDLEMAEKHRQRASDLEAAQVGY